MGGFFKKADKLADKFTPLNTNQINASKKIGHSMTQKGKVKKKQKRLLFSTFQGLLKFQICISLRSFFFSPWPIGQLKGWPKCSANPDGPFKFSKVRSGISNEKKLPKLNKSKGILDLPYLFLAEKFFTWIKSME